MQNINWKLYPQNETLQEEIANSFSISKTTAQILINRGITTTQEAYLFLRGTLDNLYNPFLMKDMDKAVERVLKAKRDNERVLVFGDYDVDGLTATSLLLMALREIGVESSFYIPNRLVEGYGLNSDVVRKAKEEGFSLLITTDTGMTNFEEIELAKDIGLDAIITDHHLPGKSIPNALAVLNPRQIGCNYPFKELAGVGIAYKFAEAFIGEKCHDELSNHLIVLSTFGTIADVSCLTGENRILVKEGLKLVRKYEFPWLRELIKLTSLKDKELTPWHIGYILAPMINAAGRLGSANYGVNLMTTKKRDTIEKIASYLYDKNSKRQAIEKKILSEAIEKIDNIQNKAIIVLYNNNWHPGVLGIVASRISERYRRPSVLIGKNGKGSARSAIDFNIYEALTFCSNYLKGYGGHKSAAGLTIDEEKINEFIEKINNYASENLKEKDLNLVMWADSMIDLKDLSFPLMEEINNLAPFGASNPEPNFITDNVRLEGEPKIVGEGHLKFKIAQDSLTFDSIGFKMAGGLDIDQNHKAYEVIFTPFLDTWNGRRKVQLKIKGLRKKRL